MRAYELQNHNGADALQLIERPQPTPAPGQILVRVCATSLNYRDLGIAKNPTQTLPIVPLSDGAGEIVEVGSGVTQFQIGDRVMGNFFQNWLDGGISAHTFESALGGAVDGMLAEYVTLNADACVPIPEYLSFEEAATLPCAALTAWNAIHEIGQVRSSESVLLLGTGGVSVFALQLLKTLGARIIIASSSDEKLERARQMGAHDLINYRTSPDWDEDVWRLTEKRGVDHVLEVGGVGTLEKSLRSVRVGGTVELIGVLTGAGEINPMPVLFKVLNLRGVYVGSTRMFGDMNRALQLHQIHPIIDRIFSFEQASEAYRYQESGAHFGKIVIQVAT